MKINTFVFEIKFTQPEKYFSLYMYIVNDDYNIIVTKGKFSSSNLENNEKKKKKSRGKQWLVCIKIFIIALKIFKNILITQYICITYKVFLDLKKQ